MEIDQHAGCVLLLKTIVIPAAGFGFFLAMQMMGGGRFIEVGGQKAGKNDDREWILFNGHDQPM